MSKTNSVYKQCSQALRETLEEGRPFTELDIVNRASAVEWNKARWKQALTSANQLLNAQYRAGKLVRFGPVKYQGELDYARIGTKIVYAGLDATSLKTPNGTFSTLTHDQDQISAPGRRVGTNRDDMVVWSEQEDTALIQETATMTGNIDVRPFERRIASLESERNRLVKECRRLTQEIEKLKNQNEDPITQAIEQLVEDQVMALVGDLETRISNVERTEKEPL